METIPLRALGDALKVQRECYSSKDGYYVVPCFLVVRQDGIESRIVDAFLKGPSAEKEARRLAETSRTER